MGKGKGKIKAKCRRRAGRINEIGARSRPDSDPHSHPHSLGPHPSRNHNKEPRQQVLATRLRARPRCEPIIHAHTTHNTHYTQCHAMRCGRTGGEDSVERRSLG